MLQGDPGAYRLRGDVGGVDVPATLQATISARIDRLGSSVKRTLNAAAVIGSRFDTDLLSSLVDEPASSSPKPSRKIGAMDEPNVVQPTTERLEVRRGRYRE